MILQIYRQMMPMGKTALERFRYRSDVPLVPDPANFQPMFLMHWFDGAEIAEPGVTGRLQQF